MQNFLVHFIVESILGYIFWSLFCGLFPMIWFYPLNELDFTGYEQYFGVLLIPIICENGRVMKLVQSKLGLSVLRIVTLLSVASFQMRTTYLRLITLSIGTAASVLVQVSVMWSNSNIHRCTTFWGLIIGFFAMLIGRIWYISILPTWNDVYTNTIVLTLGTAATVDRIFLSDYVITQYFTYKEDTLPTKNPARTSWFLSGLAFGSLLYTTVAMFSEVSVISRWVVKGYPNPGLDPNPSGIFVLVSLIVGIFVTNYRPKMAFSRIWWFVGSLGMYHLYTSTGIIGFTGGLILATYVMSIWPEITRQLTSCPPGRTLTIAMATFMIEMLFSIWTTAYNFVPGGEYTREHTGYLLSFISLTWLLTLCFTDDDYKKTKNQYFRAKIDKERVFKVNKLTTILFLLLSVGVSGMFYRSQPSYYEHEKTNQREISALIWTFHFGYDNEGWPSLERAARVLNDSGADVITLLESDASKPYLGNNDLGMWLGEKLQMYVDFGPSTRDHTWGNLILSKYPIVESDHHLLPSPYGELAPAIRATINVSGELINFVTTHMGNDRDTLDRKLQAEYLANLTANSTNPVIFLGYVTSSPGSRDYTHFITKGGLKDIDNTDRDRWCEYIMYRGLKRLGYARISHGGLSDTELQMAKFEIPKDEDWVDNDAVEIDPGRISPEIRFNTKFGRFRHGHNWARTHQFHASTPKYFVPIKTKNDKNKKIKK